MGSNEISRDIILAKTFYGAGIYSHIAKLCYPGDSVVMKIKGWDCGTIRNPFHGGSLSLRVKILGESPEEPFSPRTARHHDLSGSIPDGDAFEFAALFWKLSGQALLEKINSELHLHLGENRFPHYPAASRTEGPRFSFFNAPINNTHPTAEFSLAQAYTYITSPAAHEATAKLRAFKDKRAARLFKAAHFSYATFSGTFSTRSEAALKKHSGLLCIDFDHLTDIEGWFEKLKADSNFSTELLFRSPSGDGLKWIVSVDLKVCPHTDWFTAISNYVRERYSLEVDRSGRDVCRACFLPYDPLAYINPEYR